MSRYIYWYALVAFVVWPLGYLLYGKYAGWDFVPRLDTFIIFAGIFIIFWFLVLGDAFLTLITTKLKGLS